MSDSHNVTIWDGFTMSLWTFFFFAGLAPEFAFHWFRALSGVTTQHAFVNSSAVITIALAIYLAFFVARQCKVAGLHDADAQGKALQVGILALLAFLELPSRGSTFGTQTLLGLMFQSSYMEDPDLRKIVWIVGCCKLSAWAYLYSLMIRFHLLGRRQVFSRIPTFFVRHQHVSSGRNSSREG